MSRHATQYPQQCARCAAALRVSTVSRYNADVICMPCREDERRLPTYAACEAEEVAAVRRGDYNFHYGLSAADRAQLAAWRAARPAEGRTDG